MEEIAEIVDELDARKNENLAVNYIPNGKSEEFINLVGSNECFVNMFIAGNGTGKTAAVVNIITNICFGSQNKYFNKPLFEKFPYLKRGRIISDPTTIKEKIIPELKKWFPSNRFEEKYFTEKQGKFWESKWITDTGFEFDIMSNEQDAKEFESTDLGWVAFDEPSRKDIYTATVARMRMGGIIFWGLTPLSYSAWIKDELYDKWDGKNVDFIEATVEDNCRQHGIRGLLDHANIERMIAQYPEDEREARIDGKFGHLIGRIIKSFSRKIHVIRPFEMDRKLFCVAMALDTHPQVDDHAMWMAIDERGQKYVIAEYVGKGTSAQIAAEFKRIEAGMRIIGRLIDPSAYNEDERSDLQEPSFGRRMEKQEFYFAEGSKDLANGIRILQDAFSFTMVGNELIKRPEVLVFDTNPVSIKQIEEYTWLPQHGKGSDMRQERGKPVDKNDHQPENLRRLLQANFHWEPEIFSNNTYEMSNKDFDPYA